MNLNLFKEGFDTLPTAVCFFDSRGIVRLVNEKMIEIDEAKRRKVVSR